MSSPVFKGQVRSLSSEGFGVVDHPEGKVFFVPGTWPGDVALFEKISEKDRYGEARLLELIEPSVDRRKNIPCSHQGFNYHKCGGCPWMIGTYESQLKIKNERILFQLKKAKIIDEESALKVRAIEPSPREFGYRNRAQVKSDGNKLGFVAERSHDLIDIDECKIFNSKTSAQLKFLRSQLPNPDWTPSRGRPWIFFDLLEDIESDQLLPNRRLPFKQGNSEQNEFIKTWLNKKLEDLKPRNCIELFCGSGNFTSGIANLNGIQNVAAIEVVDEALARLKDLGLKNVETHRADLFGKFEVTKAITFLQSKRDAKWDSLVLDPPREGFAFLKLLLESLPSIENLIYVSCDLATFIRDTAPLAKLGFKVHEIQPVDMFPHTPHVEILGVFKKVFVP